MLTAKPIGKRLEYKYKFYFAFMLILLIIPNIPFVKKEFDLFFYIPVLYWTIISVFILYILPRMHVPGRVWMRGIIMGYAAFAAVILISMNFVAGAVLKKLKGSPYDMSPKGILINLLGVLSVLTARELIRAYGIGTIWKYFKYRHFFVLLFLLLMTATEINFFKLKHIEDMKGLIIYLVSDVLLIFSKNILMSVFVFYGDFTSGILYAGIIDIFQKCSPVLPELPWLATGVIGVAFPIIYALFMGEKFHDTQKDKKLRSNKGSIGYMLSLGVSVLFFWFCVGVFKIYPSVVLTGSMEPMIIPGDVVIIKKLLTEKDVNSLVNGDVINFKRGNITITHRILEVEVDKAGNRSFVTKGDNNISKDEQKVYPNDIKGIVIYVLPKVGVPILMINSQKEIPIGVMDRGEEPYGIR